MIFTWLLTTLVSFFDGILGGLSLNVPYQSYLGALNVLSYGIHVLGAPLFNLIVGSLITFYGFKLVFSIINWIWQQLPMT